MLFFWHDKFVVPILHKKLIYQGTMQNNAWVDGKLVSGDTLFIFPVVGGVPIFVDIGFDNVSVVFDALRKGEGIDRELGYIRHNWKQIAEILKEKPESPWIRFARMISRETGLIVDIAAGLGGGFVPAVLNLNPDARILISDIDPLVLAAWKSFLRNKYPYVSYACFDATRMPLRSESVDVVVSSGGFGNIPYNHIALLEAYRVLRRLSLIHI